MQVLIRYYQLQKIIKIVIDKFLLFIFIFKNYIYTEYDPTALESKLELWPRKYLIALVGPDEHVIRKLRSNARF
jgi:hypothetical protein